MVVGPISLDCARLHTPDAATIHGIARLQLAARRCGVSLRLENASDSLIELLDLCGLAMPLGGKTRRQAEKREQPGGVEEEGDV